MSNITFDFSGNNYIITGASSGMGRQVAEELAKAGANVLAIARRKEKLEELKSTFPEHITVGELDVCQVDKLKQCMIEFVNHKGKFSGAVHAAGISGITPIRAYDSMLARNIMDTSFWAGIELTQLLVKKKYSVDGASIVWFSSVYSISCARGMFAYSAAKAAANAALKSIAKEINNRNQRINSIMPGWVDTGMTQSLATVSKIDEIISHELLGIGKPTDVSGMILFLLSDRAKWITGTTIPVDGGYLA
ncbi:SDR family oxidoreductase [Pectinatus frisingensis]|uniref:SDR family oxidoreductase n=1 Tax=Pectinatus frisingensis TaxID=865 RepID=UPI0018C650F8|nr:SDR family oxidoreductase [Pectinatus frisingensis]